MNKKKQDSSRIDKAQGIPQRTPSAPVRTHAPGKHQGSPERTPPPEIHPEDEVGIIMNLDGKEIEPINVISMKKIDGKLIFNIEIDDPYAIKRYRKALENIIEKYKNSSQNADPNLETYLYQIAKEALEGDE